MTAEHVAGGSGAGSTVEDSERDAYLVWIGSGPTDDTRRQRAEAPIEEAYKAGFRTGQFWYGTDLAAAQSEIERLARESSKRARLATEWQLKNDALRAELAAARGGHIESERQLRDWQDRCVSAEADLAQARARIQQVGQSLRVYAVHLQECEFRQHGGPCTCGLKQALDAARETDG